MLPLHNGVNRPSRDDSPNAGLLFDKYMDIWILNQDRSMGPVSLPKDEAKRGFYDAASRSMSAYSGELVQSYITRRHQLLFSKKGRAVSAATSWRFVSGLGSAHPMEAGFIWHRTLGVPYLPASSIKGMMRAWLTNWTTDSESSRRRAAELFGDTGSTGMGRLIVFDAIPVQLPVLEADLMNPHYGDYYADSSRKKPPADYNSPIPVSFLAVAPGQRFEFALAPADHRCTPADLEDGMRLLQEALSTIGCGGKTAVGYGVFGCFEDVMACGSSSGGACSLSPAQLKSVELDALIGKEAGFSEIRNFGLELYRGIDSFEGEEKLIVASVLKRTWESIDEWSGKLSRGQRNKVDQVKQILGEV